MSPRELARAGSKVDFAGTARERTYREIARLRCNDDRRLHLADASDRV
jgi:hypothetical protein